MTNQKDYSSLNNNSKGPRLWGWPTYSSIAIAGDRLVTAYTSGEQDVVGAFDRASGEIIWILGDHGGWRLKDAIGAWLEEWQARDLQRARLAVEHGVQPVLGFSFYTWNAAEFLELAAALKTLVPGLLLIAGGPHVQQAEDGDVVILAQPALEHRLADQRRVLAHPDLQGPFLQGGEGGQGRGPIGEGHARGARRSSGPRSHG